MKKIIYSLLLLFVGALATPVSLTAQPADSLKLTLEQKLPLRPDVRMGQLPNGLRYYVAFNAKPEDRAELYLAVNAGSVQEDEDQLGVAHFVEHMAFNGTTHFEKNELVDYLELTGTRFGADLNAYTSFDETVYTLHARTDSLELLEKGLLILEDWAHGVTFEEEEIDKERGVVISEWRTRLSAEQRMQQEYFPVMYQGSRYAERLPIGEPEIIENVDPERIRQFYRDWYRPDLMAVIAVGDFDLDWVEKQIVERFGDIPAPANPRERKQYSVPGHEQTLYSIVTDKEAAFTSARIMYKHKDEKVTKVKDYRQSLLQSFYNRMLNFRMQEIGLQADPPFTFAYSGYGGDVGDLATYTVSTQTPEGKLIQGLEAALTETKRALVHGFTQPELDRQKAEFLKSAERAYRERDKMESNRLAYGCVYHFLQENPLLDPEQTFALYQQLLPGITLKEVNEVGEDWITDENRVVVVTGPEKEEAHLPSQDELEAMFERLQTIAVEPYAEELTEAPLLDADLKETGFVSEQHFESVDVYELELQNGVKVVLKPTDFKNDEILMSAFSPGGHSLYDDQEYFTASMASSVIAQGGVGAFDYINLQKKLSGKTVNVGPYIGELYEGISANCAPEDFETMLQMVYLYFTEPRKDSDMLQSYISRRKSILQNLTVSPEYYYAIATSRIKYGDHPRRQPIETEADLDGIDLDRAMEIYRDRFADAGDFTFILVGNFVVEEIKPLLSTYLGNLPSTGRDEQWRDVDADLLGGVIDSTFVRGQAPKARVDITFHGDFDYFDAENRYNFSSMISVLQIEMRESMREEQGGVYGVSLRGFNSPEPEGRYSISLSFTCDPGALDTLIATAMQEIENAKEIGAEEKNLQKVTEIQRQDMIESLKENRYWSGTLSTRYRYGLPIDRIGLEALEARIAELDAGDIREAARRYFNMDSMIKFVLLPAEAEEK